MDGLLRATYQMLLGQHPTKLKALASKARNTTAGDCEVLKGFFGTDAANNALNKVLKEWQQEGCSGEEVAGLISGMSFGYSTEKKEEQIELVWTGPDLNQLPVRRSEQVLLDVINEAKESLYIVSFVLINIPNVEIAIVSALSRGVNVKMLLESEEKNGSLDFQKKIEQLVLRIPGLRVFVWPRNKREEIVGGFARVHAKFAVADEKVAFLTSANLTSTALDKNIEMGVRIKGGNIPKLMSMQFIAMITSEEIILNR